MDWQRWFWGVLSLAVIGIGVLTTWNFYFFPDETVERIIDDCAYEANKVFAVEMTRWRLEHNTDAFNPYRRERDAFIETCVKRDGGWCSVSSGADIWPSSRPRGFVPKDWLARWMYNQRFKERADLKCAED